MANKKTVYLLLAVSLLFSGCGASGAGSEAAASSAAEETAVSTQDAGGEDADVAATEPETAGVSSSGDEQAAAEDAAEDAAAEDADVSDNAAAEEAAGDDEASPLTPDSNPTPKPEPTGPPAAQVSFDPYYTEDFMETAEIAGLNEYGEELWYTKIGEFPGTDLILCEEIGIANNMFYYVENGTVVALDLRDGSRVWANDDFGGASPSGVFDSEGTLFLCGYDHPNLFVVDKNGRTKRKVESFNKNYTMPSNITIDGDTITIHFDSNGGTLQLDKSTLKLKSRVAPKSGYTDKQLIAMAKAYLNAPNAVVDLYHRSDDEVEMQLYYELEDSYQNIGAFWVDPKTGEGEDATGAYVDLRTVLSGTSISELEEQENVRDPEGYVIIDDPEFFEEEETAETEESGEAGETE